MSPIQIRTSHRLWLILAGVVGLLVIAGVATALAANAAIPGDALYPLDLQLEAWQAQIQGDTPSLHQRLADERLAEVEKLAQKGDYPRLEQGLQDLNQELVAASTSSSQAKKDKAKPDKGKKQGQDPQTTETSNEAEDVEQDNEAPEEPKQPRQNPLCAAGDSEQPALKKLAEEVGVAYPEVLAWYCQGLGIGEVKLAYKISQQAGAPVAQIVAERLGGKSWGEIMQAYQLIGKDKSKEKKDKGNKP